ncbi:hypothetical protein SARC_07842, partial [Sphaeroforma arctica JP610]
LGKVLGGRARSLAISSTDGEAVLSFLAFSDACYKHVTLGRQTRQPVIDIVLECCAVLRDVLTYTVAEGTRDDVKQAERSLAEFDALQTEIRNTLVVQDETTCKRNILRQQCIDLIDNALQNCPTDSGAEIRLRASAPLDRLR